MFFFFFFFFFRKNRRPQTVNFPWGGSTAVTMKIRSRSPKSNHFFVTPQLYIQENLVRIQPLVQKILCRQEVPTPVPTGSTPKSICSPPHRLGDIMSKNDTQIKMHTSFLLKKCLRTERLCFGLELSTYLESTFKSSCIQSYLNPSNAKNTASENVVCLCCLSLLPV